MILTYTIILLLNGLLFIFHENLHKINYPVDHPNDRKIHSNSVLLSGGLFFLINLIFFFILNIFFNFQFINFSNDNEEYFFLISALAFFYLGFIDDKNNLDANLKLFLIIIILSIFLSFNKDFIIEILRFSFIDKNIYLGKFSFFFTILCLSLFINAFNMYDGINLQSGSYSLIFFIFFIFNSYSVYFSSIFIISTVLFMIKNFKSRSFLGDNGCYILSFTIGIFIIDIYKLEKIYADQIFLLMMIPGIDMLRLFIKRIILRKNPFSGDKNHLHHILLKKFNQTTVFQILFVIKVLIFLAVFFNINSIYIFVIVLLIYLTLFTKLNFS